MSAIATALKYERLAESNVTLRLLRATSIPVVAALLSTHLGVPGTKLVTDDLYERLDGDLEVLRGHFDLPKTAKSYCDDWRTAGFLIRRPATASRGETYELSADTLSAIRTLDQLDSPQSTITESRLVNLAAAVRQLAIDTDPDITRRLASLEAERTAIEEEISKVRSGQLTVLDNRRSLERVTDVLIQAQDLPADFTRVRAKFEELNSSLRESILAADETQSSVLDEVFRGVDLIESSDEGRTFTAFLALIRDPERSAALDADLAEVLGRDFAAHLPLPQRRVLRTLLRDLKSGSREVNAVLTEFARGLRRYVQSQEYQRDRALRGVLQQALAAALPAAQVTRPTADVGIDLELSSMKLFSAGVVSPHDPSEYDTGTPLTSNPSGVVDFATLAAIARESEIDFTELVSNVNDVVARSGPVTVAQVLTTHRATQGIASVVGLLSLARQQGEVHDGEYEDIVWLGLDKASRSALVEKHVFTKEIFA